MRSIFYLFPLSSSSQKNEFSKSVGGGWGVEAFPPIPNLACSLSLVRLGRIRHSKNGELRLHLPPDDSKGTHSYPFCPACYEYQKMGLGNIHDISEIRVTGISYGNNNFWSATNLCLRYASAKCGR